MNYNSTIKSEMHMFLNQKSILAKLLAKENIEVVPCSRSTASFDVARRVLYIPIWKDMSKDLYDLLMGHEVGHALFTPEEGMHEYVANRDDYPFPFSYINIIEDIRIERKVLDLYVGLKRPFTKAYQELLDRDFFGITKRPVHTLGFMDRLNLKSKARDLIDVPFTDEEAPYIKLAYSAETFEDVLDVCKKIAEFLKEKKEQQEKENAIEEFMEEDNDSSESGDAAHGDMALEEDSSAESSEENSSSQSEDNSSIDHDSPESARSFIDDPDQAKQDEDSSDQASDQDSAQVDSDQVDSYSDDDTITDENFRNNEADLVDKDNSDRRRVVCGALPKSIAMSAYIKWQDALDQRKACWADSDIPKEILENVKADYTEFASQTKKAVSVLVREFDMRKSAQQNLRTKVSKLGKLDVSKLANYKFTDDLFLRNSVIPNAKSHGMIILMDFSGSMGGVIKNVIDQAIVLASFCRKANIPFEVFSFTTTSIYDRDKALDTREALKACSAEDMIDISSLHLVNQLSSSMSKVQFADAIRMLYYSFHISSHVYRVPYDTLGGTPTVEALQVMEHIIANFKTKNGLEKTSFVLVSDGEASNPCLTRARFSWARPTIIVSNTAIKYKFGYNSASSQEQIIKALSKRYKLDTICYYICERRNDLKYLLLNEEIYGTELMSIMKKFTKEKVAQMPAGFKGFDAWFFIDGRVDALNDEFDVDADATNAQVLRAFKKFNMSKKTNRILGIKFARAIA